MLKETEFSEIVSLTQRLVQIPSENPLGSEKAIGEYVFNWFSNQGIAAKKELIEDDRFNVVVRIPGENPQANPLIWFAHLDTVPAGEGWSTDPFGGQIKSGRLYGRGSADMKGGLAVGMMAIRDLAKKTKKPKGDLILLATIDEEGEAMKGAMSVLRSGLVDQNSYVVAIEPSGLKIMPAHKGPNWYRITTQGKMAHAGMPEKGVDAIHAMSQVLISLKELVAKLPYHDELLGATTINIGKISGGLKTNIVPPYCEAEVDMRVTYPMTIEEADALIGKSLAEGLTKMPGAKGSWERLGLKRTPLKMPADSPLLKAFLEGAKETLGEEEVVGFPAFTDAAILASITGTSHCLTFGPGYLEQAHAVDEFVPVEHLQLAVEVLKKAALSLLW